MDDEPHPRWVGKMDSLPRRDILKGLAATFATGALGSPVQASRNSSEFEKLWTVSLPYDRSVNISSADTDGDGQDELGVASVDAYGPSTFGIIKDGDWVWRKNSDAAIQGRHVSGDLDGDGRQEIVFKAKVGPVWVRPYTHEGEYLWSGGYPGWPGQLRICDVDGDGYPEPIAHSANNDYLVVYDHDDGTPLWKLGHENGYVEKLLDVKDTRGDSMPEILTTTPPDNDNRGLEVIRQDGQNGAAVVWRHERNDPAHGGFTQLDTDDETEVIAVFLNDGEVHGIDDNGSTVWTVSTDLSDVNADTFDIVGDQTTDAVLWSGTELVIVNGNTHEKTTLKTDDPIQRLRPYDDEHMLIATESAVELVHPERGSVVTQAVEGTVDALATGDIDGDGTDEIIIGTVNPNKLTAYNAAPESGPTLTIENTQLVQTTANTAKPETRQPIDPDISSGFSDELLVTGRNVAPIFDLTGSNLETLSEPVPVTVTFDDGNNHTDTYSFSLNRQQVADVATKDVTPSLLGAIAGFRVLKDNKTYYQGQYLVVTGIDTGTSVHLRRKNGHVPVSHDDHDSDGAVVFRTGLIEPGEYIAETFEGEEIAAFELKAAEDGSSSTDVIVEGSYPTTELSTEIQSATIVVGDESTQFDPAKATISVEEDDFVEGSDLSIGVVGIESLLNSYGGLSQDRFKSKVEAIGSYLQRTLPVESVTIYRHDKRVFDYDELIGGNTVAPDLQAAYDVLVHQLPITETPSNGEVLTVADGEISWTQKEIPDFDATLAITPDKYFEEHGWGKGTSGMELVYDHDADGDGKPDAQPFSAASVEISARLGTAAQELGHHFMNEPFSDEVAKPSDEEDDGTDNDHLDEDVVSAAFDLESGSFDVRPTVSSFMSYSSGETWIDDITRRTLIANDFEPHPVEGPSEEDTSGTALVVSATVEDDGSTDVKRMETFEDRQTTSSVDGGRLTVEITDTSGMTIESRALPMELKASHQGGGDSSHNIVIASLPFPEETYAVTFKTEQETTRVNPHSRSLVDGVTRIPDHGFTQVPDERRKAISNKLDAVQKQLESKAFRGAKHKLENDVRDKLEKWLKDEYDAAANQYTKQEILELADTMIDRLETLARSSTSSRGNRGKGS